MNLFKNISVSNGNMKCPIAKSFFYSKFAIKTLPCYRCKCLHRKSKASPYIIWYAFERHVGEIWTKLYGPKCTKFKVFNKKIVYKKTLLTKRWRHFATRFCSWNNCLISDMNFQNFLAVFQKLWYSTCNHVKVARLAKSCP